MQDGVGPNRYFLSRKFESGECIDEVTLLVEESAAQKRTMSDENIGWEFIIDLSDAPLYETLSEALICESITPLQYSNDEGEFLRMWVENTMFKALIWENMVFGECFDVGPNQEAVGLVSDFCAFGLREHICNGNGSLMVG